MAINEAFPPETSPVEVDPEPSPPSEPTLGWAGLISRAEYRLLDLIAAFLIVLVIALALYMGTRTATAYLVSGSPDVAARWGWMQRWTQPDGMPGFHTLVCEGSQAERITQLYFDTIASTPFTFAEIQVERVKNDKHRARAKAKLTCQLGDTALESNWEAEFDTRFEWPLGICIDEIEVKTHAAAPCSTH